MEGSWITTSAELLDFKTFSMCLNVTCTGIHHVEYVGHKPAQTPLQLSVTTQLQSIHSRLQQLFVTQTCRENSADTDYKMAHDFIILGKPARGHWAKRG